MINEMSFSRDEAKTTFVLVLTFALRLMSLFMLYPIFALRAADYSGSNEMLIGIAVGVYGFPQALLQLPFGYLSDRFGRKTLLLLGFFILAIGSVLCAVAQDIYTLIIGRALQGAGAIGSVVTAAIVDYTREKMRARAMAFFGMSIGLAFMISIPVGPLLDYHLGIKGIFWLTSIISLFSILLCAIFLPAERKERNLTMSRKSLWYVLKDPKLISYSAGILFLHTILTAFFLVVPNLIKELGISVSYQSYMYGIVIFLAMLIAYRMLYFAEQNNKMYNLNNYMIVSLVIALPLSHIFHHNFFFLSIFLLMFFISFCVLESSFPALVAKCVVSEHRGLALGFFSSCQFLGIFLGGLIGGWLNSKFGTLAVIYFVTSIAFFWLLMAGYFK